MSKLLVKTTGTWKYPEKVYVKQNDRWKSAREVWVKEGDEWKISWPNNTGTITYTEPTFGVFQVPDGVYNIEVYWPTSSTYISSASLAVIPGSQISYQIGGYGEASNFGGISTGKFDKEVVKFRGNVDDIFYQTVSVAVVGSSTYSNYNDETGLDRDTLSNNALAAGINYVETVETKHGDLSANISLTPVKIDELLPVDFKVTFSEVNVVVQGGTSVIAQQPTVANSYNAVIFTNDPSGVPQESLHYYTLNLQQQTPISIKWGDWDNTTTLATTSIAPEVLLVNPNTGTIAGSTTIAISGSRLSGATSVTIGGSPVTVTSNTDTQILGTTSAGSAGSKSVVVTTSNGSNGANTLFRYVDLSTVISSTLSISPTSLPNVLVGNAYSQSVVVSGGTAPYTWNVSGSTLVNGISLSPSGNTLTIAGTPTTTGNTSGQGNVTIPYTVTDNNGITLIGSLSFVVANKQVLVSPLTSSGTANSANSYSSSGSFTVTSQGGSSQQVLVLKAVQAGSPGGAVLSTSSFTLAPGASQTVNFTATWFAGTSGDVFTWYFTAYDPSAGQNPGVDNDHIHYQTRA